MKLGVGAVYLICIFLIGFALIYAILLSKNDLASVFFHVDTSLAGYIIVLIPFAVHLLWQVFKLDPNNGELSLRIFKSNRMAALLLILTLSLPRLANML